MEIQLHSTEDTKKLAFKLAKELKSGDALALYGDLGSGKTTFVRYLAEALNTVSRVQSPTFVILREYKVDLNNIKKIYHLDLYRLVSASDVEELGFQEIINEAASILCVEWPDLIEHLLPKTTKKIHFKYLGTEDREVSTNFDISI
jgi:tRNA threonylcarbamoyladenosine biosynthesis protein TsaE